MEAHARVCILSSVHHALDTRVFHKEAVTLAQAGYYVTVIARHPRNECRDGVRIVGLPRAGNRLARATLSVIRLLRLALRENADVYHLHDPELLPLGLSLRLLTRAKIIYDIHEDLESAILLHKSWMGPGWLRRMLAGPAAGLERALARTADAVVLAEAYYSDIYQDANSLRVEIMNYPRLSPINSSPAVEESPARSNGRHRLIYTGFLTRDRGAVSMLRALAALLEKRHDVDLYLIGQVQDRQLAAELPMVARQLGVEDHLVVEGLDGFVSRERIDSYYPHMDIGLALVEPSRFYANKALTKFFEYMLAGLPIVAARSAFWYEFIERNGFGLVADPDKPYEVADTINRLLASQDLRSQMGRRGRQAVAERFNWELEGDKLTRLYRCLLERNKAPLDPAPDEGSL